MSRPAHTSLGTGVIELERRIAAPPEIVFSYFTDPERYRLWQGIGAELDPRPGGLFRVTQNEAGFVSRGEFIELDPPKRLVFSWGWEGIDGLLPGESTVEVDLVPDGDGTILRLRHSGLPSESACDLHAYGWGVGLDNLVVVATESSNEGMTGATTDEAILDTSRDATITPRGRAPRPAGGSGAG